LCKNSGGEGIDGKGRGELIYFKLYKSQIPVIEQAIETAALMLGTDKSRGYCLEMICADFTSYCLNAKEAVVSATVSRTTKMRRRGAGAGENLESLLGEALSFSNFAILSNICMPST